MLTRKAFCTTAVIHQMCCSCSTMKPHHSTAYKSMTPTANETQRLRRQFRSHPSCQLLNACFVALNTVRVRHFQCQLTPLCRGLVQALQLPAVKTSRRAAFPAARRAALPIVLPLWIGLLPILFERRSIQVVAGGRPMQQDAVARPRQLILTPYTAVMC